LYTGPVASNPIRAFIDGAGGIFANTVAIIVEAEVDTIAHTGENPVMIFPGGTAVL
jgi:hypothetical protein